MGSWCSRCLFAGVGEEGFAAAMEFNTNGEVMGKWIFAPGKPTPGSGSDIWDRDRVFGIGIGIGTRYLGFELGSCIRGLGSGIRDGDRDSH